MQVHSRPNLELQGWSSVAAWLDDYSSPASKDSRYFEFTVFWKWLMANHSDITWVNNGKGVMTVSSPDDLIRHRKAEHKLSEDGDALENPKFHCESLVKEFYKSLKGTGLADRSRREYVGAVKSWFMHATNDEHSLKLKIKFDMKRVRFNYIPVQADLKKLRAVCSPRTWALVATMKDTGLGPEDISQLRWGQIDRLDDDGYWFASGQREKTDEPFVSFFGPDSTKAIQAVVGAYGASTKPDSPVFTGKLERPLTSDDVSDSIKRAIERAGYDEKITKTFSAYSLRKFHQTQLETARVPANWVKRSMGHAVGQVEGAYSGPQKKELLRTYKSAYKFLTVEGLEPEAMTADDLATFERAKGGDALAIARILEKFGQEHELSKQLKQIIDASKKRQIPASDVANSDKSKPKKGQRVIIDASEIGNHCNHGWKAVFQFQDGRVQVEYEGEDAQ